MVLLAMFSMVSAYHYSNKQKATTKAKAKAKVRKSHKALPTDFNDDDKVAYKMIEKMEAGDKNIRIMIKKNKQFESMDDLHSLDYQRLCEVKQGYVLRYLESVEEEESKKKVMWFEPVFAVLNKQTLSLYESENVNSLITSYLLTGLQPEAINPMKQLNGESDQFANKNMRCLKLKDKANS